jgi:hypothetical protein
VIRFSLQEELVMIRKTLCYALVAAGLALAGSFGARSAVADDLFYNYYVGSPARLPAQLYISPRPVPPHVGHTWITYQPLMPHEFLYKHKRTYYRYYPHGGHTVTNVRWW